MADLLGEANGFDMGRRLNAGGRGEIRTHGTLAGTPVFKTGALNHSATLPAQAHQALGATDFKNRLATAPDATGLLDEQKPALLVAVNCIHGREQPGSLDEPRLKVRVDVENKNEIQIFQVSAYRRVMADTRAENLLAVEIQNVPSARVVRPDQVLPKFLGAEIAKHGHLSTCSHLGDLGEFVEGQSHDANACPASPRT
jgi:hypothetical protein